MAVAMTTFGSTLSDLQRLTNEDRALDYSRANAQDAVNAQRLSDFLKARSEESRTKAQRDASLAQILDAQQARAQQGQQFDVQQRNLMELGKLDNQTRKDIATLQSQSRTVDPRFFQSVADIQALNAENQQHAAYVKKLSDTRKMALAERERIKSSQGTFDWGQPNDPRWKELTDTISKLDIQAATLGVPVAPDGGYVIPDFSPIPVPAMLNLNGTAPAPTPTPAPSPPPAPSSVPPPSAASPTSEATKMLTPEEAAQLPDGTVYRGLDGRLRRRTVEVPPEATPLPPVTSPWDTRSQLLQNRRLLPPNPVAPETPPASGEGQWVLEGGRYVFKKADPRLNIDWDAIFRQLQPNRPTF